MNLYLPLVFLFFVLPRLPISYTTTWGDTNMPGLTMDVISVEGAFGEFEIDVSIPLLVLEV
jgi:hypothetical protein